jgi:heme A synthase
VLTACAGLALLAMLAGSYVSSSDAGLACGTLPACDGGSWTGALPGQIAQMTHRWIAGLFFLAATVAAYMAALGTTARVRAATLIAYALVVLQVMLGMAHAANACAVFVAFVAALVFAALDGTVPVRARETAKRMTLTPGHAAPAALVAEPVESAR